MAAKDLHKRKMLIYWGDPSLEFITRFTMHTNVLRISATTFYKHFTPAEIANIEAEAVELRKKNSSRERVAIYKSLAKEGKNGDVTAAKEFLDRTEGKVPANINANLAGDLTINLVDFCNEKEE